LRRRIASRRTFPYSLLTTVVVPMLEVAIRFHASI
jgi:hypothetical protein